MAFGFFVLYLIMSYVRPYELYPSLAPYRLMLAIGIPGLVVAIATLPFANFSFRAKQLPLVVLFAIWIALSRILALKWFGGGLDALNSFSVTLVIFFLAAFSINSEQRLRNSITLIVLLSLFLVLQAFLAIHYGVFGDLLVLTEVQRSGLAVMRARGTGFMTDPNDLAQSLVLAVPFVALAWRAQSPFRNLFCVVIPTTILLYGVYLTRSRGAMVSLAVIMFVALRSKLGGALSTLATAAGVLGGAAITIGGRSFGLDQSATNRLEAWSVGLQLLKQYPFSGVGFKMFTDYNEITAHNSFVLCFAELGLPGYFLWMMLLLITVLELNAIRMLPVKTPAEENLRRYARSIQIALYAFLASSWFLSRTFVPTLYLLIALAIAVVEMARRAGKPVGNIRFPTLAGRTVVLMMASIFLVYFQIKVQVR